MVRLLAPLLLGVVVGSVPTGGELPVQSLVGFGVAAPVVAVLWALMVQANRARDAAQAAHLGDLRSVVPAIEQSTAAQAAMASALDTLTEEHRRFLRDQTIGRS